MKMCFSNKGITTLLILFLLFSRSNPGLTQNYNASVEAIGGYTSPETIPFWLRSNKFGSIPTKGLSASLILSASKKYDTLHQSLIDWGANIEVRTNVGKDSDLLLSEGNVKIKLWIFEVLAGRSREILGLADSTLGTGPWIISGNSPGIPKLQISVPEFYSIPFLGNIVAFKGNLVHGWFGTIPYNKRDTIGYSSPTFLHQKSLYGRFGKPQWRLKLYGGLSHNVMWGNERANYGESYIKSPWETYILVFTSKGYKRSRIGNSLGTIDLGLEYRFNKIQIQAYRQNLYDAGALYYLANLRDGLNGLSISNLEEETGKFNWKRIVIEVLYTCNQAGEIWSKYTPSGDEDYFNNHQYTEGWSYMGMGIGNPFITPRHTTQEGLASKPSQYFNNNRVIAFHAGFEGSIYGWKSIAKLSFSKNYGTFFTSEVGGSMGNERYPPQHGIFGEKKQFSAYLSTSRELKEDLFLNIECAADIGELYYNSFGIMVGVQKCW